MQNISKPKLLLLALLLGGCNTVPLSKETISSERAPKAVGPYSQAVKYGNFVFVSGQIPLDPQTGLIVEGTIEQQTRQVMKNIQSILTASHMTMENVVSSTVYLTNLEDFSKMNQVYSEFFLQAPPARATVQVAKLPKEAVIEISVIATK